MGIRDSKISIQAVDATKQDRKNPLDYYPDKPKQTIWMDQIRKSEYYLIIASPEYFDHTMSIVQSEFAKSLKKPFRVLLVKGTEIPEGFFDSVDDLQIAEFDPEDKNSIFMAFKKVIGKREWDRFKKKGIKVVGEGLW